MLCVILSSSAAVRLDAARAFLDSHSPAAEIGSGSTEFHDSNLLAGAHGSSVGIFPWCDLLVTSSDVPPGQRNLVATFSGKKATRFTSDAFKAPRKPRNRREDVGHNHPWGGLGWGRGEGNKVSSIQPTDLSSA